MGLRDLFGMEPKEEKVDEIKDVEETEEEDYEDDEVEDEDEDCDDEEEEEEEEEIEKDCVFQLIDGDEIGCMLVGDYDIECDKELCPLWKAASR